MLYPENIEHKIGFDKIRNHLKINCISSLGKSEVDSIAFSADFNTIVKLTRQTAEFLSILADGKNFPVSYYFDVRESLERADAVGFFFGTEELFDLKRSFDTIKAVLMFFQSDEENRYPYLKAEAADVKYFKFVTDAIDKILDKNGNIKDNASPELSKIRHELSAKKHAISATVRKLLDYAKSENIIDEDTEATMRDGRLLIPVPASHKRKIKGVVYDESASGRTAFIEPLEVIEASNAVRELEFAERREIVKILSKITEEIKPYAPDLLLAYQFLAKIDFIRAKALFAKQIHAQLPTISAEPETDFFNVRHPLLVLAFAAQERFVVPAQIRITPSQRIILISGPNAGGKSVALKTLAVNQYMVQCGLLPAADSNSITGVYENLFIDIGDEQSLENDLSTYSSHLLNMKHFTKFSNPKTLVLIDEFGTGTEPMFGGAIAEAVLSELNNKQVRGIITTHYGNLKQFADITDGIVNAAMLYNAQLMQPLYILETGIPGSSFAFEIARKIGLSEHILQDAVTKLDKNQVDFEKLLRQTQTEKRKLNNKSRKVSDLQTKLTELQTRYDEKLNEVLLREKELAKKAKQTEKEILDSANKRIEQAIFEIKKEQADKEKTKFIRAELNSYIQEKETERADEEAKILRKIEYLKNKKKREKQPVSTQKSEPKTPEVREISEGDWVRLRGQHTAGEVQSIKRNKALVVFGSIQSEVELERLELVSDADKLQAKKRNVPGVQIIRTNETDTVGFLSSLDLRGMRGDEAVQTVMQFLDDAVVARRRELRILHGTGTGILKTLVRDYLRTQPYVIGFRDENIEQGGAGITVVELDN